MRRAKVDTLNALQRAYDRFGSWRKLARELGINHATLCGIARTGNCSARMERNLRKGLGLSPRRRRKYHRPYATSEQDRRREAVGKNWPEIIERGLLSYESERQAQAADG